MGIVPSLQGLCRCRKLGVPAGKAGHDTAQLGKAGVGCIWVCLLGLLFLAVKEERYTGEVTVSVRAGDGRTWSESVPVSSTSARDFLLNRVSWAQMVTSHAPTDRG